MKTSLKEYNCVFGKLSVAEHNGLLTDLSNLFTLSENFLNFPPDGNINKSEIEYFFSIRKSGKLLGFYKIIDLHFENKIELHGSFKSNTNFLIKHYFELTKIFVTDIQIKFPKRDITSIVSSSNLSVIRFLGYLNFKEQSVFFSESNIKYINYKYCPEYNFS